MSTAPKQDVLTDHEYDGIREFDNPTPGWWWWLFNVTVVFSVAYWLMYHVGTVGVGMHAAHETAVADDLRLQFAEIGELQPDAPTLMKYMTDERWLAVGKAVFKAQCMSCHGPSAEGQIGPNMTDDSYKNVEKITDIARVVMNGAANNAMPAWGNRLHPNEVVLVSAYMASLRGKNLPGPRGAEGKAIAPWSTEP